MHIPDSVLSPSTSIAAGAAMLPVWAMAGRRVRRDLGTRQMPLLALGAAFCFTVMLFNIPALGGTTAHPIAGTLLAVLLGPWAAVLGLSVTLAIQALFFGDGGLLTYGANCFTMAFVLPFVGYSVYALLARRLSAGAPARAVCAAIGAYIGINAAAAVVAVLLGIQPALFHEPDGRALYFPFGLKVTLPAMLGAHLLIAGPAEAVVTAVAVRYMQAAGIMLYGTAAPPGTAARRQEMLWAGLLALCALSPLGLLARGEAWGEWDTQGLAAKIRTVEGHTYVPKGAARAEAHAYKGIRGLRDYASERGASGYLGAAVLGIGTIVGLLLIGVRVLRPHPSAAASIPSPSQEEGEKTSPPRGCAYPLSFVRRGGDFNSNLPSPVMEGRGSRDGGDGARGPSLRFLERSLEEFASAGAAALAGETWARSSGLLQRLDPRAKIVSFLGLIAVVAYVSRPLTLLALTALTLVLALSSRLSPGRMARRVWLPVLFFIGSLALPSALSWVTPGRPLLILSRQPYLAITAPGLEAATVLMLRVGVAVSFAALLTMTTGWSDLLSALRVLPLPRLFLHVLAMTYRYLVVLLQAAAEMFVARRSRAVGRATRAQGREFLGVSIGALFGKTLALSEEVHAAMLSRGFHGQIGTLTERRWRRADSVWLLTALLVALAAWRWR
ncbi:MAG TPA: cobalt transporter CbiM [Chthonomonadaceae bacterium]|nr:cobalt transporter CbiM [Chthonomonadaceae bacterium]